MKTSLYFLLALTFLACSKNNISKKLFVITENDLYGFIDAQGKTIISSTFDIVCDFSEGLAYARKDSTYGFIDENGKFIIERIIPRYIKKDIPISDGHMRINKNKLKRPLIESINGRNYFKALDIRFSNGLAAFIEPSFNKYGYINKKGKYVIEPKYELAYPFSEGLALVKLDGKYGFIDEFGQLVIDNEFDYASSFHCNRAVCQYNRADTTTENGQKTTWHSMNVVVIDKTGSIINSPQGFVMINDFSENISVKLDLNKQLLYDGKGFSYIGLDLNPKTDYYYSGVKDFSESWSAFKYDELWGFIKNDFESFIEPKYENVQSFSNSLAAVKIDDKWGYIDTNGNLAITNKYDTCKPFKNGLAYVKYDENGFIIEGYLNEQGAMIWHTVQH